MHIQVFSRSLKKRYYASLFSCSCLYYLLALVLLVTVPFFLAHSSYDFWVKVSDYREQIDYEYQYKVMDIKQGFDENGFPITLFYSSIPQQNQLFSNHFRPSTLQSIEVDENADGINERLELSITSSLTSSETITSHHILVWFDLVFSNRVQLRLQSLPLLLSLPTLHYLPSSSSSNIQQGVSSFWEGKVEFTAKEPLNVHSFEQLDMTSLQSLFEDLSAPNTPKELMPNGYKFSIPTIQTAVASHNYSIAPYASFSHVQPDYDPDLSSSSSYASYNSSIILHFPTQDVTVYTPPAQLLKQAWIQYVAMLLLVSFVLNWVNEQLFHYQVLPSRVYVEGDKRKNDKKRW